MRTFALSAAAALAAAATFSANVAGPSSAFTSPITNCVGSSHGSTTLRSDWRAHLTAARQDIGFNQVRFHGVLDDDMSTYLNGQANMANVFNTYDFLLSIGVRPIVELSFMPEDLASDPTLTVFHYKGGISAPKNWTQWSNFIQQFASLLVQRYGIEEVSQWKFEVWNEPNCGFYYEGNCCGPTCGNQTAYFELYAVTALAVKSVSPLLQIGGPATAQTGWIPEFLQFVKDNNVPVDFVSSHLYPTDPMVPTDRDGFLTTINASAAIVAQAGLPLVMTEFNAGLGINVADGPYSGAFVVHQHLAFQGVSNLDTLSFWTFSDVFEEGGFDSLPYDQKFGMQTIFGVPKPVYRAFQLIAALPANAVPVTGTATKSGQAVVQRVRSVSVGNVDVAVATKPFGVSGTTVGALVTNFNTQGNPIQTESITITFSGVTATPSPASVTLVDDNHAYALPVWTANGSPVYPNNTEILLEKAASQMQPSAQALTAAGPNTYSITLSLLPSAVAYVEFSF